MADPGHGPLARATESSLVSGWCVASVSMGTGNALPNFDSVRNSHTFSSVRIF